MSQKKKQITAFSKETGVPAKDIMKDMRAMGFEVKNNFSVVPEEAELKLLEKYGKLKQSAPAPALEKKQAFVPKPAAATTAPAMEPDKKPVAVAEKPDAPPPVEKKQEKIPLQITTKPSVSELASALKESQAHRISRSF